ncbi:MAG: hypothetical protein Q9170_000589 [Blastenia crenularia]
MTTRTEFHISGCTVRGFPTYGGIVLGTVRGVELEWLGLSRSEPSLRSLDPQEEDEFCYQMLRLGGQWFKSEAFRDNRESRASGGYPYDENFPPKLQVGYPGSGGVWVLKQLHSEELPDEFAKVEMAFTMDERCVALEAVGAKFYANISDCTDIPASLEDGITIGKYWEAMLKAIDE